MILPSRDTVMRALAGRRAVLLFAAVNLLFLLPDVALAHSAFLASRAEFIPMWVSAVGGLLALTLAVMRLESLVVRAGLALVALVCLATGVAGMAFHLGSEALGKLSLHRLVYSAPIIAPLAYAGLGLLLLAGLFLRDGQQRGRAIELLAGLGLLGNFVLCLLDHAQNGFWAAVEWVSVVAGAVGGLSLVFAALVREERPGEQRFLWWVMAAMAVVGLLGAVFHVQADLGHEAHGELLDRLRYGAPVFAPLLFVDLAALGVLGMLTRRMAGVPVTPSTRSEEVPGAEPHLTR